MSVSTAKDQGRLVEVHGKEKNLTGRRTMLVGQINDWQEVGYKTGQLVSEVAWMREVVRSRVEEVKGDIRLLVEKRKTIVLSSN